MAITTRLIGKLGGGGRPSQEFTVGSNTVTRSVGEGRWLAALSTLDGEPYIDGVKWQTAKVVTGPTTVTFRITQDSARTGFIAPLD